MGPYVQRCKLCGSNGRTVVLDCKWCQGLGIQGNGEAGMTRGQIKHRLPEIGASGTTPLTPFQALTYVVRKVTEDMEAA